jgi:molecular chaperone DnaK (HSP70)
MAYVDYRTGLPRIIPDRRGQVLVPSVVSFTPLRGIPPMPTGIPEIKVHILDRCRRPAAVEATERHAAAAPIICKPTYELYEAEITRMIAGGRPEGGIECS